MKKNKRSKMNAWICEQLAEQGISFRASDRVLTKTIQYPLKPLHGEDQVEISISSAYNRRGDQELSKEGAMSDIHQRIQKIVGVLDKLREVYPNVSQLALKSAYESIAHQCAASKTISRELHMYVENYLLLEDISTYENVQDYPDIFPHARNRKRKIIAFLGETNSGKTFNALSEIANSFTSAYLAPLRLLALETYEYLNSQGIATSLITGEEKIHTEDAVCTSSTVECFNPERSYETIVIDEIQMMDDPDRGAFFIQALIGGNADKIIVTGPPEYKDRLEGIAKMLGEEIEVHVFKRKTKIKVQEPIDLSQVKKNTAIVTFSRRNIFAIRDQLPKHVKSSVIYGALGYEVRKKQAEQFVSGETDVLITTDAIGMGLNLPIETILFTTDEKYDGKKTGKISHMLTKQIAGRAGRYKKFDTGYVTALNHDILNHVVDCLETDLFINADAVMGVRPTPDYIETMLVKYKLSTVLSNWCNLSYPEGSRFFNIDLTEQTRIAQFLEKYYPNDVKKYYKLIFCPVDYEKDYDMFAELVDGVIRFESINFPEFTEKATVNTLEQLVKRATLTLWFAHQFPNMCSGGYESFLMMVHESMELMNAELHRKITVGKRKPTTSKTGDAKKKKKRTNNVSRRKL